LRGFLAAALPNTAAHCRCNRLNEFAACGTAF
jgi:hypothetical protein